MTAACEIVEDGFDVAIVSAGNVGIRAVRLDCRALHFQPLTNKSISIQSKERLQEIEGVDFAN
jgi:hypothetical protein